MYVSILGRQPEIGLAELESLYGADNLQPIANIAVQIDVENIDFDRLGGSVKLAKLLTILPHNDWNKAIKYIADTIPAHLHYIPEGKIKLGLSAYGFGLSPSKINASALQIKKVIKSKNRGVRIIPNKEPELSTAQVIHNGLTSRGGLELILIKAGKKTYLAQTLKVQDINAYSARDQKRPARDARVGMLPPKLAQIIINLASNRLISLSSGSISEVQPEKTTFSQRETLPEEQRDQKDLANLITLDPFCGTGVILQEALLMGYSVCGSDLDPRMVEYSQKNIDWLEIKDKKIISIEQADACDHTWLPAPDLIACETYLGRPLSSQPDRETIKKIVSDCDTIHTKFLKNIARQTKEGFRMCTAVPAWKTPQGFKHLPTLDNLENLGYNRAKFVHAPNEKLIYHRPGQIVARELVVLERI